VNAKCDWNLIKRLAIVHIASGREILNILNEVKKLEREETQQLYTAYIERTTDHQMAPIDKYNADQLGFLMEGNCHNIYSYHCKKIPGERTFKTFSCSGQGLFFGNHQ
jgi:hypothetical protein